MHRVCKPYLLYQDNSRKVENLLPGEVWSPDNRAGRDRKMNGEYRSIDVTKPERWILRCQRLKKENRRRTPARPWER